ncbi:MAG: hypothetical protein ACOYM2_15875 [Rectinemataceae bacterium]
MHLAWWRRSIVEGERLGAKIELAHALYDAGCLLGAMRPGPEWRKRGTDSILSVESRIPHEYVPGHSPREETMTEGDQLTLAIDHLQGQRSSLGDAVNLASQPGDLYELD